MPIWGSDLVVLEERKDRDCIVRLIELAMAHLAGAVLVVMWEGRGGRPDKPTAFHPRISAILRAKKFRLAAMQQEERDMNSAILIETDWRVHSHNQPVR